MTGEVFVFPTSFAQQRLWFLDQMTPGLTAYNVLSAVALSDSVDRLVLQRTLDEIARRHEALRTTFDLVDGRPVQSVGPARPIPLAFVDLTRVGADQREEGYRRLAAAEAERPFDLQRGPLIRGTLVTVDAAEHVVLLTLHHIVTDGWSASILERELRAIYEAFSAGRPSPLPDLPVQYADFAVWQRRHLSGPRLESQRAWWKDTLAGAPAVLNLPADRARPAVHSFRGASLPFRIPASVMAGLKRRCQQSQATLFMGALAVFAALLHRYTGQDDIVIGTPVAGRAHSSLEHVVGLFVNTVVVRIDLSGDPLFVELLARVREAAMNAYAHQEMPFEQLVADLAPDRRLSHSPLIQVMFTLDAADPPGAAPAGDGGEVDELEVGPAEPGTAKFDLTLALGEAPDGLHGVLEFNTDLFDERAMAWLVRHYHALLEAVVADHDRRVSSLPMLAAGERELITTDWNRSHTDYPADQTLHAVFDAVAAEQPGAVAIVDGDRSLSYGALRDRAERLASRLRALGVRRGTLVGVCAERSLEQVMGTLAVVKAGGAYVPLDPSYPRERLRFMIEDTDVPVILTTGELAGKFADLPPRIIRLDGGDEEPGTLPVTDEAPTDGAPEDVAYVIYTSGSTGQPKGVIVPHRAVLRLVQSTNYIDLRPEDVVAHASNVSFDAATFEMWGALLNGARLVVIPRDVTLSPLDLARRIAEERITAMFITTPLFHQLAAEAPEAFGGVRHLLFGGDVAEPRLVRAIVRAGTPPARLVHVYGPTENTTFTTWHLVTDVPEGAPSVPIGRPIANTDVYLLDRAGEVVPIGVPGEVYVGGDGLAHGYLGRPEPTAASFVPHPFRADIGARLYRTGDLGRYRPDGVIEFLGRIDGQVKIRGFRVEPGEVEVALGGAPGVREVAVVPRQDARGDRQLVAYVVGHPDGTPSIGALRHYAQERLPDYMVPGAFVLVPGLPLTANGKIDRRALPEAAVGRPGEEARHVAPQTDVERAIAGIWQEVLRVERVGLYDNFFDLGGHSLLLVRVLDRLRQALPAEPTMLDLFRYPTVAALARHLGHDIAESGRAPVLGDATDEDDWAASVAARAAMLREAMPRRVTGAGEETVAGS